MPEPPDHTYLRSFVRDPPRPILFEDGLTPTEIEAVEQHFDFAFPPDLRTFLTLALPVSEGFPNWRSDPPDVLRERLARPVDGICFDVEHNAFWYDPWGARPADLKEACALREDICKPRRRSCRSTRIASSRLSRRGRGTRSSP